MQCGFRKVGTALAVLGLTATAISVAIAQGPRGGGRRMGPPMGPPMGPGQEMTAANAPLQPLEKTLKLTSDQRTQILAVQQGFREAVRTQLPPPPSDGSGRPDPATMNASMKKVQALDKTFSARVEALLSADQKLALNRFLSDNNDFRVVGFAPPAIPLLNLTGDQRANIHAIAVKAHKALTAVFDKAPVDNQMGPDRAAVESIHRDAHESALAVLTDEQKAVVAKYQMGPRGGPMGGPMGPPPGGPMGPPDGGPMGPPDGGPMGPPDGGPMGPPDGGPMGPPDGGPMGPPDGGPMGPPPGGPDGWF